MVILEVKVTDTDRFLYHTTSDTVIEALVKDLTLLRNVRIKLGLLADAILSLAEYGPSKPEVAKGIDHIKDEELKALGGLPMKKSEFYNEDPSGERTGDAPAPKLKEMLKKVSKECKEALSENLVLMKKPVDLKMIEEKLSLIKGAVMIAYPMGLPKCDPIFCALNDTSHTEDIYGTTWFAAKEKIELWWAGKVFHKQMKLSDRIGKNEKTKVVVQLQKKGSGPPVREPLVSNAERKAMMAHYFKKQEEAKKLAENDEDDYHSSSWADPNALRSKLNGTDNIRIF